MIVYHGSVMEVRKPLVKIGRSNLDFGQGFYVTDIKEQAVRWAKRLARQTRSTPVLNQYEFNLGQDRYGYRYLKFTGYNREWLDFIVNSRNGIRPWQDFDIIEGGIANDRVIDTIESYMSELISAEKALDQLSLHSPNNQICILNQALADECLNFISYEQL